MPRHLISVFDLDQKDIWKIITTARKLKSSRKKAGMLSGRTLGLIFEKPSTRTTVSFAVAMHQLGGLPLILNAQNLQRKRGESIKDTAKTLSRYVDCTVIRAMKHSDVEEFARNASIPVINGLTDKEHPCQVLGDLLTIAEKKRIKSVKEFAKVKVAFVGDGNNMANSWIAAASILGFKFTLARPKSYGPDAYVLDRAQKSAVKSGASIEVTTDPKEGVRDADVVYTDVWTSMGEEAELEQRKLVFKPYQVNRDLLKNAREGCMVMHCLPAIRGEEITSEIMDNPGSVIFDQAENRLHIQKAILLFLLK
ncbi:MAG: ornithine carbamoyltransferase [Endomicrobiales bacterium]|nr:ornithine carbamoyltransferase [Endomicrobiales bacterium]